jgi:hypothetical protein
MLTGSRSIVVALVALAVASPSALRASDSTAAVALVASLSGTVSATTPGADVSHPLQLFDWLAPGTKLRVADVGSVVLAFSSGKRWQIGPGARVNIGATAVEAVSGQLVELPAVGPLPAAARLAAEAQPGARSGALRIRGNQVVDLYPRTGVVALPDHASLRFRPVPGATGYRVAIEDEVGAVVFQAEARDSPVAVSPGVLKPGSRYRWTVRALGPSIAARGEEELVTLDAGVDRGLGLLREACDGVSKALAAAPADDALRAALAQLERDLGDPRNEE